ncbi:glycosyl hydrolase [Arcobacter suis]|uniref:Endo-1,3-beta-glucanase btgC n=1 Tax=Arcobacter suis CECT 7833 TaxID=663365 RepID=A0AAD0WRD7_9BACT|nr:glycosyl hydrolase [Arcobacter suis]AXX90478.1 putative glycosyl hydrolase [Arcobacter suis CECT 7833]RWS45474.1 glycosyl hydrolase [Arcobacter suis]
MKKISLTLASLAAVVLFWYILGTGFVLKDGANSFSKLQCVSYAPFGKDDSPFMMDKGLVISEDLVRKDLQLLSKYTDCIRTYSTVGLEMIPKIARENNLKMLMGAWVNGDEKPTRLEIDTLIKLAKENKDIVRAVIVGNEALLRGDLSDVKLYEYIKEVKAALPDTQVTYADVWEYWLKYPKIKEITDFVTIHILPYWEDDTMNIEKAIAHLAEKRAEVENELKTSNILIGETGWPSEGRMREDALPSKTNQAIFVRDFVKLAQDNNWNYNIIEAFDQPWKRVSEGAVGGFWGLFDKDRADKNVFKGDVSDFPNYKYLGFGSLLLIFVFSFLLKNSTISTNKLVLFSFINTIFAVLYMLQMEQFNITVRSSGEVVWATLVLLTHLAIYYLVLLNIAKESKPKIVGIREILTNKVFNVDTLPMILFYSSFIFVLISTIILAFEGRYRNFEIYVFAISAISFVLLYGGRFANMEFKAFEKLSFIVLLITSIISFYNEGSLNIFSNIWIIIALIFTYILFQGSKNSSYSELKTITKYIAIFFIFSISLRYGIIADKDIIAQCHLNDDTLLCGFKNQVGYLGYIGVFGIIAICIAILALFINNKKFVLVSLFASVFSIMMFNTYVGSIAFILTIIVLCKEKNLKVLNS